MDIFIIILVVLSLLLAVQACYTLYLMLYTWNDKHLADDYRSPRVYREPHHSFTVLLPAKSEEEVIQGTIRKPASQEHDRPSGKRHPAAQTAITPPLGLKFRPRRSQSKTRRAG